MRVVSNRKRAIQLGLGKQHRAEDSRVYTIKISSNKYQGSCLFLKGTISVIFCFSRLERANISGATNWTIPGMVEVPPKHESLVTAL